MKIEDSIPKTLREYCITFNKKHPGVIESVEDERAFRGNAPYWIYLNHWQTDPCLHTIAAYSVKEAINDLKRAQPCTYPCECGIGE